MEFENLWGKLELRDDRINTIRKDWTEGKVPDLPFVIIDQQPLKSHIGDKLGGIDGDRMTTTVIKAQYGDGKTNVLKYLTLYFEKYQKKNVHLLYCRADVDQTDICLYLLQHLQNACFNCLLNAVLSLREQADFKVESLANDFRDEFSAIKEYALKLFAAGQDEDVVRNLLYLGTGRLYSIGAFQKHGLQKLTDFNRREVFVMFMNMLSECGHYFIFAVDELEKINDKSSKRMTYFFNSYRELVDLFNKVKGHYLITTITNAVNIETLSPPLWGRIKTDIITIDKISKKEDIRALAELMGNLLGIEVGDDLYSKIERAVDQSKGFDSNRTTIQTIASIIRGSEKQVVPVSIMDMLNDYPVIKSLYDEAKKRAEDEDGFMNLSRNFFDPLSYYLESLGYNVSNDTMLRRDYQAFIDTTAKRAFMFLFNDDTKVKSRIQELKDRKGMEHFVVFVPQELTVTHASLGLDGYDIKLIDYDPRQLFVLLNIYRWNFDQQNEIFKMIGIVTESVFE